MEVASASSTTIISSSWRPREGKIVVFVSSMPCKPYRMCYTQGCAMENLQFNSKHPIIMNLLSSSTNSPSSWLVINFRCSTPISFMKPSLHSVCNFPCHFRSIKILSLCICQIDHAQSTYSLRHGHFPEYKERWQSRRIANSRPQNDWESLSPTTSNPKGVKGVIPLPT